MPSFNNLISFFLGLAVSAIRGTVFDSLINAVSPNPGLTNQLFDYAILGFVLT
jgi:F0F1-type ATP synthase membrane subunit c/vacuolar-type H+-ATPase subunit K